jgi:mycofactocin precursor
MQEHETLDDATQEGDEQAELLEELLIEEISIDGMCGVY